MSKLQKEFTNQTTELEMLRHQLKEKSKIKYNEDIESRLLQLTGTLMTKQDDLELMRMERNGLKIQLEKLEVKVIVNDYIFILFIF